MELTSNQRERREVLQAVLVAMRCGPSWIEVNDAFDFVHNLQVWGKK